MDITCLIFRMETKVSSGCGAQLPGSCPRIMKGIGFGAQILRVRIRVRESGVRECKGVCFG
jgi:hypothetical protein